MNVVWRTVDGPNGPVRVWSGTGYTIPPDLGQDGDGLGRFWTVSFHPAWGEILPLGGVSDKTPFLDALAAMEKRKETTSEKVRLNGRPVVKFRATEAKSTYTVWVDPQTKLPVQIEYGFPDASREGKITRLLCTDFVWDPKVADVEEFFRTDFPKRDEKKRVIRAAQPANPTCQF